jgi:hypothetical protein
MSHRLLKTGVLGCAAPAVGALGMSAALLQQKISGSPYPEHPVLSLLPGELLTFAASAADEAARPSLPSRTLMSPLLCRSEVRPGVTHNDPFWQDTSDLNFPGAGTLNTLDPRPDADAPIRLDGGQEAVLLMPQCPSGLSLTQPGGNATEEGFGVAVRGYETPEGDTLIHIRNDGREPFLADRNLALPATPFGTHLLPPERVPATGKNHLIPGADGLQLAPVLSRTNTTVPPAAARPFPAADGILPTLSAMTSRVADSADNMLTDILAPGLRFGVSGDNSANNEVPNQQQIREDMRQAWLAQNPVDGLNLYRMCRNNPATFRDTNRLITQREIDLANRNALLALRQTEAMSAMSQIADSLPEAAYTEQTATTLPAASDMPGEEQNNNDEDEKFTHSGLFSHTGYRFALRFLPMRFFRSKLAKYITSQKIRPKIRKGEQYQSTGKLKAREIMAGEAKQIADQFKALAESCNDQISNGLLHTTPEERYNISLGVDVNAYLSNLAGLKPSDPDYVYVAQHYYKLVRSGDDTTYALALVTFDKDKNLTIEGVTVHPSALLRSQQVETPFDIKGLGTSLSIQSVIRAFKSHPIAKRINTNAVNQFSARIFNRAVSRFS